MKLTFLFCAIISIICLGVTLQITLTGMNLDTSKRSKLFGLNENTLLTKTANKSKVQTNTDSLAELESELESTNEAKPQKKREAEVESESETEKETETETEDKNTNNKVKRSEEDELDTELEEENKPSAKKLFKLKNRKDTDKKQTVENTDPKKKKRENLTVTTSASSSISFGFNEIKMKQATKWKTLFKTIDRKQTCTQSEQARKNKKVQEKDNNQYLHNGLPFAKASWDEKHFGGDAAGYYFDYLDACWRKQIVDTFKLIYGEAKKVPDTPLEDPYSVENQLKAYSSMGLESKIPQEIFFNKGSDTQRQMEGLLSKINPKFNVDIYAHGITYPQLRKILKDWNWITPAMADYSDPAKHILDKFDYDGNGRLDPREFLFFSIKENLKMLGDKQQRKNFYDKIIDAVLEPFFVYADCDGDGIIDAENIWFTSQILSCRHPVNFDIYKCDAKSGDADSDYRTSSVNDLVLKNMKQSEAFLSKQEFYKGILLGFWDRQVSPRGVMDADELNGKYLRWGGVGPNFGELDTECQQIKRVQMGAAASVKQ